MQAFPSNTSKMEQLCFPPPPPPPPLPRPSFMPPPPPPLSLSPKRYEPRGSSPVVRPVQNRFSKSPDQRHFQRPHHLPFLLPPPPPKFRNQAQRQHSSPTAQYRPESQITSLQRRNREGKDDNTATVTKPATEQQLSPVKTPILKEETGDTRCDVKDEVEEKPCTSVEDSSPSKTERKRPFENESFSFAGLPKELTQKFGPLTCELCSVSVNSTVQARMHYKGKQHEKKVHSFLMNWSKETGEPLPKQFKDGSPKKNTLHVSFCEVCNIPFTSPAHAAQHYMGRNHRKVLAGRAAAKAKVEQGAVPADDPSGRFGIGVEFNPCTNSSDPLGLKPPEPEPSTFDIKKFFCELCQVFTTSQDQLDMHLRGSKHRKAEAANKQRSAVTSTAPQATQSDSILASVMQNEDGTQTAVVKDYSIYRTPSGYYYCQPCNSTSNSEAQFIQHCESKKHKVKTTKKPISSPPKSGNIA